MKILLIGKTGQLGSDILRLGGSIHNIYAPERNILDIGISGRIEKVLSSYTPDVVINTAAYHNVPLCETEYAMAFKVNCIAVKNLAEACRDIGAVFVTFSTDYVFDGGKKRPYLESDKPSPLQIYGISKLAGEFASLSAWIEKTVIIRTCGLYGLSGAQSKGGNFVDKRIMDAQGHNSIEIGCDQIVSPTYTNDLAKALFQMIAHADIKPGIYHMVNEGECSWYEFTNAIYKIMGLKIKVMPVDRKGLSGKMRRPLYSALSNTRAAAMGITLPTWRNALERYLMEKYLSRQQR